MNRCKICKKLITKESILGYCRICSNKFAHPKRKKYFCECGKELSDCRHKICQQCFKGSNKGKNNGNFKGGLPHCKYCNIELTNYRSEICKSCHQKYDNSNLKFPNKEVYCEKCKKLLHKQAIYKNTKKCKSCIQLGKLPKPIERIKYRGIWMRSTWEVKYAKWLDERNIKWYYESSTFDLGDCTYTPDFYLPKSNTYVEIKGWMRPKALKKLNKFKKIYKAEKLILLNKEKLINMKIIDEGGY